MRTSLKCALVFGVAPLASGIAIFLAWVLSRADWLMMAGIITIYVGVCSVAVGAVCLAIYLWKSWRSRTVLRRRLLWHAIAILALYAANFVGASAAVAGVFFLESRYTVSVVNESNIPLQAAKLEGGGVEVSLGDMPSGVTVKRSFFIEHDGELVLTGIHGTRRIEATVDGYVTNSLGGDKIVVLSGIGVVNTSDRQPGYLD